jgi:hypothetical protein
LEDNILWSLVMVWAYYYNYESYIVRNLPIHLFYSATISEKKK